MKALAQQVWDRIEIKPEGECWNWPGATTPRGYGKIGREGRTLYVHRVAYEGRFGGPLPRGLVVMHKCDNPGCCNPKHLLLGTKADNSADMVAKRRSRRGEAHALHRLTSDDVADIRARKAKGELQYQLADEYGVSKQQISNIVRGRAWAA